MLPVAHQPIPVTALSRWIRTGSWDGWWFSGAASDHHSGECVKYTIGRDGVVSVTQQGQAAPVRLGSSISPPL